MPTYRHPVPTATGGISYVIIDYERTARDTYKVEFSGELLRSESIADRHLWAALRTIAGEAPTDTTDVASYVKELDDLAKKLAVLKRRGLLPS